MKRFLSLCIAFLLMLPAFSQPAAAVEYNGPCSAKAAVLIEATTGRILYAKNENCLLYTSCAKPPVSIQKKICGHRHVLFGFTLCSPAEQPCPFWHFCLF